MSFGKATKQYIKPFTIPDDLRDRYLKAFLKYIKISICGCWEWQGRIVNNYGCLAAPDGCSRWVHRVSYALFNGRIAENMHVDHKCRNSICANPIHLKQCTPIENYQATHRRKRRDEKHKLEAAGQLRLFDYTG